MATKKKQNYVGAPMGNQNAKGRGKSTGAVVGAAAGVGANRAIGAKTGSKVFSAKKAQRGLFTARTAAVTSQFGKDAHTAVGLGKSSVTGPLGGGWRQKTIKGVKFKTVKTGLGRSLTQSNVSGKIGNSVFAASKTSGQINSKYGLAGLKVSSKVGVAPTGAVLGVIGTAGGMIAGSAYNQYKKRRTIKKKR